MKEYPKFYRQLNEDQRLAVDTIEGPLLVLAGPGTGKTQLLSVRAGSILDKRKAGPENILILTYTNSAAKTMKERLVKVIGPSGYEVEVGTFHSFANSIIQGSEEAANYVSDMIPMGDIERMRVMEYILDKSDGVEEIRPFRAPYTYLKEILQKISELKKDGITPHDLEKYLVDTKGRGPLMEDKYEKRLAAFSIAYKAYEKLKTGCDKNIFDERGRYDFDDMILFATEALRKEKALLEEYQRRYLYVMVDEFQDTNGAQLELLFTLLDYKNPNLLCVGDDDQSIYRFQGASVRNFKLLSKHFPGIKILSLKNNYRSSRELIDISGKIIGLIPVEERVCAKALEPKRDFHKKEIIFREFTTEEEELIYIVDKVRELKEDIEQDKALPAQEREHPYNNIAVLVRKRGDILRVIDAFLRAGIPYATDGKEDIGGEKRVKQLLDVLELASAPSAGSGNSKDLLLYKVLTSDYLQIPHCDILRFMNFVNAEKKKNRDGHISMLEEFLRYFSSERHGIKFEKWQRLHEASHVINRLLRDAETSTVHTILIDFIKHAGMLKFILKEYDTSRVLKIRQLRSISSFVNMVKASDLARPGIRLGDFLAEIKTRKDHDLPIQGSLVTLTQEGVKVYTSHGAKGLEFHSVIIPFCLHNKNWPIRPIADKIQLPADLFKTKGSLRDKESMKRLALQDETRLFYVAMTRAKSNLIFTASPSEDSISSLYLNEIDIAKDIPLRVDEEELTAESLETTDLDDPFVGTESVLRDMIDNLSLNPTRLNNYITCRRRFLFNDILKLPGAKKKSLVFGNCVHKALEETYREYLTKKRFPQFHFFEGAFEREIRFQGVDKIMERDCLAKMKTVKPWFEIAARKAAVPIGLERKLLATVGDDIIFTGKYDKVEWEDQNSGLVRIVDYKTGDPTKHLRAIGRCTDLKSSECDGYLRQLVAYRLLYERDKAESKGRRVGTGALVFIEPVSSNMRQEDYKKGEYVTKVVQITDEMVRELESVIEGAWHDIQRLKFEKFRRRDKNICASCDFDHLCWD